MGLDMYLYRKTYVKNWEHEGKEKHDTVTVKRAGKLRKDINPDKVAYIIEDAGYWRKANGIHRWFVENVQDGEDNCGTYDFEFGELDKLRTLCKAVLDDHSKAEELLPTESGFFFGGTEYDEWYFKELEETVTIINDCEALDDMSREMNDGKWSDADYQYHSSW